MFKTRMSTFFSGITRERTKSEMVLHILKETDALRGVKNKYIYYFVNFQEKSCYYLGEYAWVATISPGEMTFTSGENISAQTKSTWGSKTALEIKRNTEEKQCKTNWRQRRTINYPKSKLYSFFIFVIHFFFFMVCYKLLSSPSSFLETQQMWSNVSEWEKGRWTRNTKACAARSETRFLYGLENWFYECSTNSLSAII